MFIRESMDLEFDFSKQPLDRYKSTKGRKGPKVPNPRKQKHGLNDFEEEQLRALTSKLRKLEIERDDIEDSLYNLKEYEMDSIDVDESTQEESYAAYVMQNFGEKMLDVLNSGISYEEKMQYARQVCKKANDDGSMSPEEMLVMEHENDKYMSKKMEKDREEALAEKERLEGLLKKVEEQIDKVETKIYNLNMY